MNGWRLDDAREQAEADRYTPPEDTRRVCRSCGGVIPDDAPVYARSNARGTHWYCGEDCFKAGKE